MHDDIEDGIIITDTIKVEEIKPADSLLKRASKLILLVFAGLYLIGLVIGANELIMISISPYIQSFLSTPAMSAELVFWANLVIGPVRFIVNIIMWYTVLIVIALTTLKAVSKVKFISDKQLEVFKWALIAVIFITI